MSQKIDWEALYEQADEYYRSIFPDRNPSISELREIVDHIIAERD